MERRKLYTLDLDNLGSFDHRISLSNLLPSQRLVIERAIMDVGIPVATAKEIPASTPESGQPHVSPASGAPIAESYLRFGFLLRLRLLVGLGRGRCRDGGLRSRSLRSQVRRFLTGFQEQGRRYRGRWWRSRGRRRRGGRFEDFGFVFVKITAFSSHWCPGRDANTSKSRRSKPNRIIN